MFTDLKMKKNLLYLLGVLLLALAAWYTVKQSQRKSTLSKLDFNFGVPDTASITKIIITPLPGQKMVLERKDGYWSMNERHRVLPILMELLLSTIRNVEMQRPVEGNEATQVYSDVKKRHRKVEIFVAGEPYKTYLVADDAPGYKGTYFLFEGGAPYVCHLRGFDGFLTPRYNVTELEWRDKLLFSSSPRTFQSIQVEFPEKPQDSYTIAFNGKELTWNAQERLDTAKAIPYINQLHHVYLERFLKMDARSADSLLKLNPDFKVAVKDLDKSKSHLLHMYEVNDPDRVLAYMPESSEWITIQRNFVAPLVRRKNEFIKAN